MKSDRFIHSNNCVYNIAYHIIWCPKYRRKILINQVKDRLIDILKIKSKELKIILDTFEIMPDHIHLFIKSTPNIPIYIILKHFKGYSSKILRNEFKHLKTNFRNGLWSPSYFIETIGCINENTIRRYIENQTKY